MSLRARSQSFSATRKAHRAFLHSVRLWRSTAASEPVGRRQGLSLATLHYTISPASAQARLSCLSVLAVGAASCLEPNLHGCRVAVLHLAIRLGIFEPSFLRPIFSPRHAACLRSFILRHTFRRGRRRQMHAASKVLQIWMTNSTCLHEIINITLIRSHSLPSKHFPHTSSLVQ